MRSFIKSHRKSNSLDSSPSKAQSDKSSQRSSYDHGSPPRMSFSKNTALDKGPSSSVSYESLHKTSSKSKIFSSKIFKKPGSHTSKIGESNTAPNTPVIPTFKNLSSPGTPQSPFFSRRTQGDLMSAPTIKGTRTHEWGSSSKDKSHSVIILNRSSTSSDTSSDLNESGLGSHVKLQRGSVSSETSSLIGDSRRGSSDYPVGPNTPTTKLDNLSEIQEKHPYFKLRTYNNKAKNRLARIHSHEDFLSLEKSSGLDLYSLSKTFGNLNLSHESQELNVLNESPGVTNESPGVTNESPGVTYKSPGITYESPDLTYESPGLTNEYSPTKKISLSQDQSSSKKFTGLGIGIFSSSSRERSFSSCSDLRDSSIITNDRSFEEGDDRQASSFASSASHRDQEEEEAEEDYNDNSSNGSSDNSSKFSFEMDGVNGRTSSVKYYSRPKPATNIYIDDIYEDDDFNEDMNILDDEDLDESDFGDHMEISTKESRTDRCIKKNGNGGGVKASQDSKDSRQETQNEPKNTVKGYNDLFDISDDDLVSETSEVEGLSEIYDDISCVSDDEETAFEHGDLSSPNARNLVSYGDIFELPDDQVESEHSNHSTEYDERLHSVDSKDPSEKLIIDYDKDNPQTPGHFNSQGHEDISEKLTGSLCDPTTTASTSEPKIQKSSFTQDAKVVSSCQSPLALPPPAKSQVLKYHDLSSNLDYDVPGAMSNLFFIDETEEDYYNKNQPDDHYLDEINDLPEDFTFSADDDDYMQPLKSPVSRNSPESFKRTHSYSDKPTGVVKENQPSKYKLELRDKVVTFFNSFPESPTLDKNTYSPDRETLTPKADSPIENWQVVESEPIMITPSNSFSRPNSYLVQGSNLSPIQEHHSSVDNSPRIRLP